MPLESCPEIFNALSSKLGFPTEKYQFTDIFALEEEIWLGMMPQPIIAVILAFPIKEVHSELRNSIRENGK